MDNNNNMPRDGQSSPEGEFPEGKVTEEEFEKEEFEKEEFEKEEFTKEGLTDELLQSISEGIERQTEDALEDSWNQPLKEEAADMIPTKRKKKKRTGLKVFCGIFGVLLLTGVFFIGTPIGRRLLIRLAVSYVDNEINRGTMTGTDEEGNTIVVDEDGNIVSTDEQGNTVTGTEDDSYKPDNPDNPNTPNNPNTPSDVRSEEYVTNVLLVGIESVLPGSRADTIMIASLNTKDKTIKLTSILRDTYVQIPGYNKTKINASYGKGGIKSVCETVETNFKVKLDGYVLVGFDGLESIINQVGGVKIELTEQEANYLNTTNYISKEEYRNVKPGVNILNGNQVVGYCRVRKVPTLGGAKNDFGRTVRQRRVLSALFEAYKSKGIVELVRMMNNLLGYVTTDLTKKQMEDLLVDFIENRITEIESLRLPAEKAYIDRRIDGVGAVLDPDLEANIEILYDFLFDNGTK